MKTRFLLFFAILGSVSLLGQETIFVDPVNNTTELETVRDQVRAINGNMTGDITIILRNGTHHLDRTLELTQLDGGSNGFKVIWKGETQNGVFLSGGETISGWTLHDAEKNIYRASVADKDFRQLYINGTMATRARTPNVEEDVYYGPYYEGNLSVNRNAGTVRVGASEISNWERLGEVELVMMAHWYHNRLRIESFATDGAFATITPKEPEKSIGFNKDNNFYNANNDTFYYFENAMEFLDSGGEWYLNKEVDSIYYKPRQGEDLTISNIIVPRDVETLISFKGMSNSLVKDIEIMNLRFEHTTYMQPSITGITMTQGAQIITPFRNIALSSEQVPPAALEIEYALNINVEGNVFGKLGGCGLKFLKGVKNSDIIGNVFYDIAANGIVLDIAPSTMASPATIDQVTDILVANNFITRVGRDYNNAQGILAGYVKDCTIEHNEITDFGYSGMQIGQQSGGNVDVGMSNNLIRYNEVHDVGQLLDDVGGIYTLSRQSGTLIFENYVYDIIKGPWSGTFKFGAIYNDNYSEFITSERNVLLNNTVNIFEQVNIGAQNNTYIDNDITDQSVMDNAGLQSAFVNIKSVVPEEPIYEVSPPDSFSGPIIQVEDMDISGAAVTISSSFLNNGVGIKALVSASNTAEAEFTFTGTNGTYNLTLGYISEDDGQSEHKIFVNSTEVDSWNAPLSASGFEFNTRTVNDIVLNNGDIVKVTGKIDQGALGRMDYLELSPVSVSGRIEAEDMTLAGATVQSSTSFSNGSGVKPSAPPGNTGEASFVFSGATGVYDVQVAYLKEDDGQAQHTFSIGAIQLDNWTASLSSSGFELAIRTLSGVTIANGDVLSITGTVTGGSHGRLDYLELLPVSITSRIEAEDMDLLGAIVNTSTSYSNNSGVKPNAPVGNTGEASFSFNGSSGLYDIIIGYLTENDGRAQHTFSVGTSEIESWTAPLAGSGLEFATRIVNGVNINNGDVLKITGTVTGGSHGRMDYLEYTHSSSTALRAVIPEAEALKEVGFQVYPNPVKGYLTFNLTVEEPSEVVIEIYDFNGRLISQTKQHLDHTGTYEIEMDQSVISILRPGMYVYKIRSGEFEKTGKLIVSQR